MRLYFVLQTITLFLLTVTSFVLARAVSYLRTEIHLQTVATIITLRGEVSKTPVENAGPDPTPSNVSGTGVSHDEDL